MKCQFCDKDFQECEIQESHDVPCYLFEGNRKGQKNQADKWGRHQLCKECHNKYEISLKHHLRIKAKNYFNIYFKGVKEGGKSISKF